jgi:hypothetical protein
MVLAIRASLTAGLKTRLYESFLVPIVEAGLQTRLVRTRRSHHSADRCKSDEGEINPLPNYSARSASLGLTDAMRNAGTKLPANAMTIETSTAAP